MVDLVHQREQPAEFVSREPFAGEPIEVMPRQVGNESPFVFAEGHGERDEAFQVGGLHRVIVHGFRFPRSGTVIPQCYEV